MHRPGDEHPTAVRDEGSHVDGLLSEGLDDRDLEGLDEWEGVSEGPYRRVEVEAPTGRAKASWPLSLHLD
ncbi:hypothetical protein B6U99_02175 [Candidatus Geothermarchaeota archaeon ex4572_27]|nr:MAG: hypothetical protein B6U99_02175 [Candidatus Geothermarchaeota archaeon ex4572_27]